MSSASVRRALAVAVAVATVAPVLMPASTSLGIVLPLVVASLVGLGVLWAAERREPLLGRSFVLVLVLLVLVVAVANPPRRSRDLWAYAFYGRMVNTHHVSPYVVTPSAFPHDPGYSRVDAAWRHDVSVYSPGFTWISEAFDHVTGDHPLPTRLAYQGLAALAVAGAAALVGRRTGSPVAALLVAVNPVALVWTVNCGHGDAIMGLATVAAVLAAERRRPVLVGLCIAAAALIKAVALLALLPLAWWLWRHHRRPPEPGAAGEPIVADGPAGRWSAAALRPPAVAVGTALVIVGVAVAIAGASDLFHALGTASVRTSAPSIWRGVLHLGSSPTTHQDRILISRAALAVIAVVAALASWSRSDRSSPGPAVALAVTAFIVGSPYTLVWYWAWVLPVVLLQFRTRLAAAIAGLVALQLLLVEEPRGGASGVFGGMFTGLTWTYRAAELAALGAIAVTSVVELARRRQTA